MMQMNIFLIQVILNLNTIQAGTRYGYNDYMYTTTDIDEMDMARELEGLESLGKHMKFKVGIGGKGINMKKNQMKVVLDCSYERQVGTRNSEFLEQCSEALAPYACADVKLNPPVVTVTGPTMEIIQETVDKVAKYGLKLPKFGVVKINGPIRPIGIPCGKLISEKDGYRCYDRFRLKGSKPIPYNDKEVKKVVITLGETKCSKYCRTHRDCEAYIHEQRPDNKIYCWPMQGATTNIWENVESLFPPKTYKYWKYCIKTKSKHFDPYKKYKVNCHDGYEGVSNVGEKQMYSSLEGAKASCDATKDCNGFVWNKKESIHQLRTIIGVNVDQVCGKVHGWVTYVNVNGAEDPEVDEAGDQDVTEIQENKDKNVIEYLSI